MMLFPLNMLDFRTIAKSLACDNDPELRDFIKLCQTLQLDAISTASSFLDNPPELTQNMHYPLIERQILQIFLIDSYLDDLPDSDLFLSSDPYRYYTDSCHDDLLEMLDYHPISDDDTYALMRRLDNKLYEITDEFSNIT